MKCRLWLIALGMMSSHAAFSQAEIAPWGNVTGVRIEGQLFPFETRLILLDNNQHMTATGKELQRPVYKRTGNEQVVATALQHIDLKERLIASTTNTAALNVFAVAKEAQTAQGLYLAVKVPGNAQLSVNGKTVAAVNEPVRDLGFKSGNQVVKLVFSTPLTLKPYGNELLVPVHTGNFEKGDTASLQFTFTVNGKTDKSPVTLTVNAAAAGRVFDGFGGNFRLQNPATDPQVIDYCLENMRVAWGRVEMPWRFWQRNITDQPLDSAKAGRLHPAVKAAMEMAQRLYKKGMPVILSAWSAPAWAVVGEPKFQPGPDGVWGNPLNAAHTNEIYRSIADYISCLQTIYGVEAGYFSFNESDLGINIRQTPEEHAALIKGLGAYLQQRGLKTKLLLGDNSDATTWSFLDVALNDPATYPYIGAVSFHSWRGWEKSTLEKWAGAAQKTGKPLIVGEGSIDAQAWGYPAIFEEPVYALEEINLYVRLLNICQPASILQWQLTADYSPLAGGGIFGDQRPLQPTQRFWNLKQLAATPAGLQALQAASSRQDVSIAALGNKEKKQLMIHLVNNGAARKAVLNGLPAYVKELGVTVTSQQQAMKTKKTIPVHNGVASLDLESCAFITLAGE